MSEVSLVLFVQESPCLPVGSASKPPFERTVRARHYNLVSIIVVGSLIYAYIHVCVLARARGCGCVCSIIKVRPQKKEKRRGGTTQCNGVKLKTYCSEIAICRMAQIKKRGEGDVGKMLWLSNKLSTASNFLDQGMPLILSRCTENTVDLK